MKANMKKLLTAAFLALLSTGAFAQTTSGSIVVSGSAGYSNTSQNNGNNHDAGSKTFSLMPSIGYLIQDGLEVGTTVGYSYATNNFTWDMGWDGTIHNETKSNIYSISPYLKKYFVLADKFALTGSAQVGFSAGTANITQDSDYNQSADFKIRGFNVAVVPGLVFFPTEKIGITASFGSFGYNEIKYERTDVVEDKDSNTGFNLDGTTLGIGFKYYINR